MFTSPASCTRWPQDQLPPPKAPAKKAAAKKPTPAAATTLKAIFEQIGTTHDLPKRQAHAMLADLVTALTTHLKEGTKIRMSGLDTLEVRKRAARMGRNPATDETIKIKASNKVAFRAANELKEAV
jgi:DNA-binding protein HU-beta